VVVHVSVPPVALAPGATQVTVKVCAFDSPPPLEVTTVILKPPTVCKSLARISAVSCVLFTNAVVRAPPAKCTSDLFLTKSVPFTVSVNAPLLKGLLVGEILVVVGVGALPSELDEFDAVHRENPSRPNALMVSAVASTVPPRFVQVDPLFVDLYNSSVPSDWLFSSLSS
jgi:hypothetical protein